MTWVANPQGLRLGPVAKGSPQALVVLLHDLGQSAATMAPIATRWASAVPTTAFMAPDDDRPASGSAAPAMPNLDAGTELILLDQVAAELEPVLELQLRSCRLDAGRLVLVGFGYGGTLALHLALCRGWSCAGVLAFAAKLIRPLPRVLRVDHKIRLIDQRRDDDLNDRGMREVVGQLAARGIDARGTSLAGPALSDEAIRHGGAYLVELVATAQRGNRYHQYQESSHAN